jgi:glycyl-tRNA synthetase beta chain
MSAADLLFEVGVEEIPSEALDSAVRQLDSKTSQALKEARFVHQEIKVFGTPRRLVLWVKNLASTQMDVVKEIKGPAKKIAFEQERATKAAEGFAKSQGVKTSELVVKKDQSGEYVYAIKKVRGQPAAKILPDILKKLILDLNFSRTMRWTSSSLKFIRPIRWLLCLYGTKTLSLEINGVKSSNQTFGHRFLSSGTITINNPQDYFSHLRSAKVLLDQQQRQAVIEAELKAKARLVKGNAEIEPKTFSEVVNLVEWPSVLVGSFPKEFLRTPPVVIKTAMESHQRYFPIQDGDGRLLPYFLFVHNGENKYKESITKGHERVIRARLADATFFFKEDTNSPLKEKIDKLKDVTYLQKLGTVYDKVLRLQAISSWLADRLQLHLKQKQLLLKAAQLSKADLVTEMVSEFPELQGAIGREYALVDGENKVVAEAIYEHYLPRFANDKLPQTKLGQLLSLTDKVDHLVGCFIANFLPTGSQDPYSVRRQTQGAITILVTFNLPISLTSLVKKTLEVYRQAGKSISSSQVEALENFLKDRLERYLVSKGYPIELIEAVVSAGWERADELNLRLNFLASNLDNQNLKSAILAFTRCRNLAKSNLGTNVNPNLLEAGEEKELYQKVGIALQETEAFLNDNNLGKLLDSLAKLRPFIDNFFDAVLVMCPEEEIRSNRLKLLNLCVKLCFRLADLSKLA